ncbi:MAG TPA: protocatechuate 3,4-dioxygenase subunit alpha [Acidimicrobiia bacterium]|nr:protocatechuate 3,4-dioxygenase subunit alpha [Acidimicrobiia bacterium]
MSGRLGQTPSQTVGPFYSMRLGGEAQNVIPTPAEGGERIVVTGRVFDGDRRHVEDALLEVWQAGPAGRFNHPDDRRDLELDPTFTGFARVMTDFETGVYRLETVRPGRVPDPHGGLQAPHLSIVLQGRGMLNPVFTRIYFSDESEANAGDGVLQSVPDERRSTLIATMVEGSEPPTYELDIRFQGDDETVFFDV